MFHHLKLCLLLVAEMQLVQVATSERNESHLNTSLAEDELIGFSNMNNLLYFEANQNLTHGTCGCKNEIDALRREMKSNELKIKQNTQKITELEQIHSYFAEMNQNLIKNKVSECKNETDALRKELQSNELQIKNKDEKIFALEQELLVIMSSSETDLEICKAILRKQCSDVRCSDLKLLQDKKEAHHNFTVALMLEKLISNLSLCLEPNLVYLHKLMTELDVLRHSLPQDRENVLLDAAQSGDLELLKDLITAGVDLNAKNSLNDTALMNAVLLEKQAVVKMLIEAGANVNIQDVLGRTALHIVASKHPNSRCELHYLRSWHDCNQDANHSTSTNNLEIVKLLLQNGAQVNIADNFGNTPLHDATKNRNTDVVKILVSHGAV